MSIIIQTYTGKMFDLENPKMSDICILDIAHSLSMQCRFAGHTMDFYSVAEHCILGSDKLSLKDITPKNPDGLYRTAEDFKAFIQKNINNALAFLLHDAAEAYITDIPRPIKKKLPPWIEEVEQRILDMIFERFGVAQDIDLKAIKAMDQAMCSMEKQKVYIHDLEWPEKLPEPVEIKPMFLSPDEAKKFYIHRFKELSNG